MITTKRISDITYAEAHGVELKLDLYRPNSEEPVPTVIYLHGGGWARGDRTMDAETRLVPVATHGIAVVSVDYRLAPDFVYPAPIHDVKAAVRWVRAHGAQYGLHTEKIGLWGVSAGGMLAALAGLTPNNAALEGTLGDQAGVSSTVQAVVNWFGPTDFVSTATRTPFEARILPPPVETRLFGPQTPEQTAIIAREASPLTHVSAAAPPFLTMHGDRDRFVSIRDAQAFHDAMARVGAASTLVTIAGAGHEDPVFDSAPNLAITAAFLRATLQPAARSTKERP